MAGYRQWTCQPGFRHTFADDREIREFVRTGSYINGIEGFWGFAKTWLTKCRGKQLSTFNFHKKECEFRFNCKETISLILLKYIRSKLLKLS